MKQLVLTINEEEALKSLLNEEIEEVSNSIDCQDDENRINPYIENLQSIKNKIGSENKLTGEIKLGFKIGKLKESYSVSFKDVYEFLIGKKKECYYFVNLKSLYDEFGYEKVNETIIAVGKEYYEVSENE